MKLTPKEVYFTKRLLEWHQKENFRKLPWKKEKDPYRIWLSEIMLQQTQAETVEKYYHTFLLHFPTIQDLAKAEEQFVFKLWEGLGYYNRCRNLIFTAKEIVEKYQGVFPNNYENILNLKGIGQYTAAAISSFAFNKAYAVVDGNVLRILARYFNLDTPVDTSQGKVFFEILAQRLLDVEKNKEYNQAIMDFGASICKPQKPICDACYLQSHCQAFKMGNVLHRPIKNKKIALKERKLDFILFKSENYLYIQQRKKNDIWPTLYQFYELKNNINTFKKKLKQLIQSEFSIYKSKTLYKQSLTHLKLQVQFYIIEIEQIPKENFLDLFRIESKSLEKYAFPKVLREFIEKEIIV